MRLGTIPSRALTLLAALVAALGGCSDDDVGTRIYVIVDSGDLAAEDLESVTASVDGRVSRAELEDEPLPRTLILQYAGDGNAGQYRVELTVTLADGSELVQHVDVMFRPGEAIEVPVVLRQACILSEPCEAGRTCVNDGCAQSASSPDGGVLDANPGTDSGTTCETDEDCPAPSEACMVAFCTDQDVCAARVADDGTECGSGMRCGAGECLELTVCGAGVCQQDCGGSSRCFVDCAQADSCEVSCSAAATCFVDCADAETCEVSCRNNASCFRCEDDTCASCDGPSCGG